MDKMREEFEKAYAPHQLLFEHEGHYAGTYQSSATENDWKIFKRGYQAALQSKAVTSEELADFEKDYAEALRPFIMDDAFAAQAWAALANVSWYHPKTGAQYSTGFRSAGGFVEEMRGGHSGDYMNWYCSATDGVVSDKIHRLMKKRGWSHNESREICDEPDCLEYAGCGWTDGEKGVRYTCHKHMGKHQPSNEQLARLKAAGNPHA